MPKVLITAGPTMERIDSVRSIINHSTGELGREIAHAFNGLGCDIIYIRGKGAIAPDLPNITEIVITDTASLQTAIADVFAHYKIDIIIHAMAVSDYRPKHVESGKISSQAEELVLVLEKTPKVIGMFRGLAQDAILVGFKLVTGLTQVAMLGKAYALLTKNSCDMVLANQSDKLGAKHKGWLVKPDKTYSEYSGKTGIAQGIAKEVWEKWEKLI
ncbi:MAG: hypothetical protein FWE21_10260 [Defluviitaleaceae bacterium]|nr:hypothetical protein [Defluviitaleaceae bacterium]